MQNLMQVLLLTEDSDTRRRWAEMLDGAGHLFLQTADVTSSTVVDVVVTDYISLDEVLPTRIDELKRGEIGVVAIDSPQTADVYLPPDFLARELKHACQLLAEVIRLRRRQQRGDHLHKALTQLALSDPLTGLSNRRAWEVEFRARVEEARDQGRLLCLAIIDLDNFKHVNDLYGYVAGDEVIRMAAKSLFANVRSHDFVARYGGDEFVVLISDALPEAARAIIERTRFALCNALSQLPYGKVSASVGIAVIDSRNSNRPQDLFAAADRALHDAKASGRDQVVIATSIDGAAETLGDAI